MEKKIGGVSGEGEFFLDEGTDSCPGDVMCDEDGNEFVLGDDRVWRKQD